jgi:hypothetical protein
MSTDFIIGVRETQPNAGAVLSSEAELRFRQYYDDNVRMADTKQADGKLLKQERSSWENIESIHKDVVVRVMKKPLLSKSKVPAVEFTMFLPAPPKVCVQFFQDLNEQGQKSLNPHLEELVAFLRIVKDKQIVNNVAGADPLGNEWYKAYKNVSYIYTRFNSTGLGVPPIDAVNLSIVRTFPEGPKGSWILLSMSAHSDAYKMNHDYTRIQNYISFTILEPYTTADGATITRLRTVETLSMNGFTPSTIITAHIPNEIKRFILSRDRIVQIMTRKQPATSTTDAVDQ